MSHPGSRTGVAFPAPTSRLPSRTRAEAAAQRLAHASAALLPLLTVLLLAVNNGGYYPTAWGWSALGLLWTAAIALVVRSSPRVGRLEVAFLAGLAAFTAWTFASVLWTSSTTQTVLEGERALVYLAAAAAVVALVRRRSYRALLGGTWAAVALVCGYSLLTRLFPERMGVLDAIAGNRLSHPLGYWNALGIFAALGAVLALGLAARGRNALVRALAAASLPILLAALYFTFSRGAWVALALGALVAVALETRRLSFVTVLLALAPWPAAGVWLASRSEALTTRQATVAAAALDGRRLAVILLALAAGSAAAALAVSAVGSRVAFPRGARVAYAAALVLVVAVGLGGAAVRLGSPLTAARDAYDAFRAPAPPQEQNLNERLFSFSGGPRIPQWRVAWDTFAEQPLLGTGAGTYEQAWLLHRRLPGKVRDAHSLYLENLAELGAVGLGLLLTALCVPLVAALRARRRGLVPAAAGAYVAYLAHAGIDWDWELTAVTLAALLCGAGVLVAARAEGTRPLKRRARAGTVVAALLLAGVAFVGLVGNSALAASRDATTSRPAEAAAEARKAQRWAPWSAEARQALGAAQRARGNPAAARRSYREAVERDPGNWRLWYELALVTDGREQTRALARAARLNPLGSEVVALRRAFREARAAGS
ncbi:MAG: O-antigen ligase family protein [Actinobacteria bacterium]|nr:O-antigen ligase family protein [Actinomycetota bacterium]